MSDGRFTKETASAAGKKGGRTHSAEHMAKIGSVGGSKPKRHRCPECNTLTWARYCSGKCSLKAQEKEKTMDEILGEIKAERANQDRQWGGPSHDDMHTGENWRDWIMTRADRSRDLSQFRRRMIQIAALAVAAIEWADRAAKRDTGNMTAPCDIPDQDKGAYVLALEACAAAIKTVECPSIHSMGEYRWHRLARLALEKARAKGIS